MNEQDKIRLRHRLDAAREAVEFAQERSPSDLRNNRMFALAVVKDIEIIGEAASKVSEQFQKTAPHIPWADIIGMRNRLIHAYFNINFDIVWGTVTANLPPLILELEKLVAMEDEEEDRPQP